MLARLLLRSSRSVRAAAGRRALSTAASAAVAAAKATVYRPRRAMLYMPGSNPKMLAKATSVGADSVCMDLEDAVAANAKAAARANVVNALNTLVFPPATEALVRINPVGSGLEHDDVQAVRSAQRLPDGVVLPKVESATHVQWLAQQFPTTHPVTGQPLAFLLLIESARALVNLREIVSAAPGRTAGVIFGADDYAADMGATRTASSAEVWYARNRVLVFAKAYGLQALDMVQIRFQTPEDRAALTAESRAAFELGFTGKQVIHPSQVAPVHAAFSPDPKAIAAAKRVVDAAADHAAKGTGAFALDGKMIDAPTVLAAQRLLAMGQACGIAV